MHNSFNFELNPFLVSISLALDYAEKDIMHVTVNHAKRCAFVSLKIAEKLGLSAEERCDLCTLALMHDCGITEAVLKQDMIKYKSLKSHALLEVISEHCVYGERYLKKFPFLTKPKNAILYHHEHYDGSGYFGKKGDEIPLMAQIIGFADMIDTEFNLKRSDDHLIEKVKDYVKEQSGTLFSPQIVEAFLEASYTDSFWFYLSDKMITESLYFSIPEINMPISDEKVLDIISIFSHIVDAKSEYTAKHLKGTSKKAEEVAEFVGFDERKKLLFIIAANLHDIGKLAIPTNILEKKDELSKDEVTFMKQHSEYGREILKDIKCLGDAIKWAISHHERLDGSGYPHGISGEEFSFEIELLAVLDIYQALTEERPYRKGCSHREAMNIIEQEVNNGRLRKNVLLIIEMVFASEIDKYCELEEQPIANNFIPLDLRFQEAESQNI